MKSGVYRIEIGSYFYFGHSRNLMSRKSQHICELRQGTHRNRFMQRAYNVRQEFQFIVISRCIAEEAVEMEQSLITENWGNGKLMNLVSDARSSFSCPLARERTKKRNSERRWTEESRRKLRQSRLGQPGNKGPRPSTRGHRNPNAKLSLDDRAAVIDARKKGEIIDDIAERFGVHSATIQRLCRGSNITGRPRQWTEKQRLSILSARAKNPSRMSRNTRGEKSSTAILLEKDVFQIRSMIANGLQLCDIAKQYGVKPETIGAIKHKRTWTHI